MVAHPEPVVVIIPAAVITEFFIDPAFQWLVAIPAACIHWLLLHHYCFCLEQKWLSRKRFQTFLSGIKWENTGSASAVPSYLTGEKFLLTLVGKNKKQ